MAGFSSRIDTMIGAVSPRWALSRRRDRAMLAFAGAYDGARSDRAGLRAWQPSYGSADADLLPAHDLLRRRSRDLRRNSPLAAGAIATVTTNAVGSGLWPLPRIDRIALGLSDAEADDWERQVAIEWALFADSREIDVTRAETFAGLQSLAFRSTLENGDVFVILRDLPRAGEPYRTRLQLIESDRVADPPRNSAVAPKTVAGIELDALGAPVAYWIGDVHPGAMPPRGVKRKFTRIPAFGARSGRRVIHHLYRRLRVGQTRGEPYLTPVIETIKQLTRYGEAEIQAAVINSCFAIVTKTDTADGFELAQSTATDDKNDAIEFTGPGQMIDLGLNESVDSFTPGRPSNTFDPFVIAITRQIGVALELPYEVLIKHFTASYSAARASLLEAWRFFRDRRVWLVRSLCQPVYGAFLEEAVLLGRLDAPGFLDDPIARLAWCKAEWIGPPAGQIDPLKEVQAAEKRLEIGVTTLERETAELTGGDWEANARQRGKERAALGAGSSPPSATDSAVPPPPSPIPADQQQGP